MKIIIDIDGVLTDGKLWIDHEGNRSKGFHNRDIRAIKELIANGYTVTLATASTWKGAKKFAEHCKCDIVYVRDKSELSADIAVIDDVWDLNIKADVFFCPSDADKTVLNKPGIQVLRCNGGEGVIAELIRVMYK